MIGSGGRPRRFSVCAASVAAVLVAAGCSGDRTPEIESHTNRMGTSGMSLTLDGNP